MIFVWNMLIVFTCIYSIAFKSVWHSFEKVAFRTHSSPCERVWHCLSSCTTSSGNLFRYMCIAIPWKEGDVSVRKCSMTPWNGHLNNNNIPCRKSRIILKRYSSKSSSTWRNHCIPWAQCGMPLCNFPWKRCNIVLSFWWHSLLRKNHGPCKSGRPNGAAGRKHRNRQKNKKHWKNQNPKKDWKNKKSKTQNNP